MSDDTPAPDDRPARRLAMLEELAELGMELARALKVQALAALEPEGAEAAAKVTPGDPVLMFTRVARAVRQTLALETRLSAPQPDLDAEADAWREEAMFARRRRKEDIRGIAETILETQAPPAGRELLREALDARLEFDRERDEHFTYLPTGVLVARVCAELGVEPDWSLWADEPWAIEEARQRYPGSPFAGPAAPLPPGQAPPEPALAPSG